jgi:hypothetical protein
MEDVNNSVNTTTSKPSSDFKKPVKTFRSGQIQASVWENQTQDKKTFLSITFNKSWKDKLTEQWKTGNNYNKQDLGNLLIVTMLAAQFVNKGE